MKEPKAPVYYMLAEKRAYLQGWRNGWAGIPFGDNVKDRPMPAKRWPNAWSRGYWEGFAAKEREQNYGKD